MVKTTGPKGDTFSFNDKACSSHHIATVSGSGDNYTATWGTSSGSCTTLFTDKEKSGKKVGAAKLTISNKA